MASTVAPTYVLTDWKTSTFLPGSGLPIINNLAGTYISDQPILDAVQAAAVESDVNLVYSDDGNPPVNEPGGGGGGGDGFLLPDLSNLSVVADPRLAAVRLGVARIATPEQYGATGDGVTDDTGSFQAAVDSLSALGGGVLQCTAPHYVLGGLVLKTGVVLTCDSQGRMSGGARTTLITPPPGYTGWVIDTPNTAIDSCAVLGFLINGGITSGSSPDTGGIRFQDVSWGVVSNVGVAATSLGCVQIVAPSVACLIENCTLQNFWQYRAALTSDEGTLTVGGTDHMIRGNQCNGGDNTRVYDAANFHRCGILMNCWTSWLFDGNGEYADVGIKVTGKLNKLTSARADVNAGRGIMVTYIGNILSDITVVSNSVASSGTYDGVYLDSGAYDTIVDGVTSGDFLGVKHRYVVNDQVLFGTPDSARDLPVISNVRAVDNSYAKDLINHLYPFRSMLPPAAGALIARPASRYMHGTTYFDTVDNKLTVSDGTHWRDIGGDLSGNIVPLYMATMAGGGTGTSGWSPLNSHTTLALADGWAKFKRPSMLVATSDGAGSNACALTAAGISGIVAGREYTFAIYTLGETQQASVTLAYEWLDSGSNIIGSLITGAAANNTIGTPTLYTVSDTAPANAVAVSVVLTFTRTGMAAGEKYDICKFGVLTGAPTDYVEP